MYGTNGKEKIHLKIKEARKDVRKRRKRCLRRITENMCIY
jgi:hypothetical protein